MNISGTCVVLASFVIYSQIVIVAYTEACHSQHLEYVDFVNLCYWACDFYHDFLNKRKDAWTLLYTKCLVYIYCSYCPQNLDFVTQAIKCSFKCQYS